MPTFPRFATALVLVAALFAASPLSAQYDLGSRIGGNGSGSTGSTGSGGTTGSTGSNGSSGDTGSGTGGDTGSGTGGDTGSGSGGQTITYGPADTDLGGGTVTLATAIFNGGTVSNGTFSASNYQAYSGEVTAVLTGNAPLSKNSPDDFTLSSASTYTGSTHVLEGTLKLGATGSIANSSIISIASGATFDVSEVAGGFTLTSGQEFRGMGNVIGGLTVTDSANLTPGSFGNVGTLTFAGGLAFQSGAILNFDLGSVSDLLAVSAGLLAGPSSGAITLNLYNYGDFAAGTYLLFDFTGATLNDFDLADFTLGYAPNGYHYYIDFNGSTLELSAHAIPEPATVGFTLGAAALAAVIVRRRRLLQR